MFGIKIPTFLYCILILGTSHSNIYPASEILFPLGSQHARAVKVCQTSCRERDYLWTKCDLRQIVIPLHCTRVGLGPRSFQPTDKSTAYGYKVVLFAVVGGHCSRGIEQVRRSKPSFCNQDYSSQQPQQTLAPVSLALINGQEVVLAHHNGACFDRIMMDLDMSVMNAHMHVDSLIVGMTSRKKEEEEKSFMNAGLDYYYQKPLTIDVVRDLVEKINRNG
ncbi:hypothetical protein R3W88_008541 [Solanum pinnatisectum]|uniref:Response regulatory domain-containing protein n=1 Tax=Solanum pinnatisectum TaxID=50273 RepID=A0AAV9MB93_9SOLN|nr:hypothetical protein R3W88_008541 [Solanum pinnatisectum]